VKKIVSLLLTITIILTTVLVAIPITTVGAEESTPAGEAIGNASKLSQMVDNGTYYLSDNIELDENWTPLSVSGITLDGNGYSIKFVGARSLFGGTGNINGLTLKNITFTGAVTLNDTTIRTFSPLFSSTSDTAYITGAVSMTNIVADVDVTVKEVSTSGTKYVAGFCSRISGASSVTIDNVKGTADFRIEPSANNSTISYAGGIFSLVQATSTATVTINACSNEGTVTVLGGHVAVSDYIETKDNGTQIQWYGDDYRNVDTISGIFCVISQIEGASGSITVTNCVNKAPAVLGNQEYILDTTIYAGVVGNIWGGNVKVEKCENYGEVNHFFGDNSDLNNDYYRNSNTGQIGGVLGRFANVSYAQIIDCTNHATLYSGMQGEPMGGIIAEYADVAEGYVTGCKNIGALETYSVRSYMGGIIGRATSEKDSNQTQFATSGLVMTDCENIGAISFITKPRGTYAQNIGIGGMIGMIENKYDDHATSGTAGINKYTL